MLSGWETSILTGIITVNQMLTAGISITAFSLLLYALTFNLRDRVAGSFAIILLSVVIVFTCEAVQSTVNTPAIIEFLLGFQWVGLVYLPAAYLHLSDALLVTAGRPSRGRRKFTVLACYLVSTIFLVMLAAGLLVGPVVMDARPAPHLQRTLWTEIFTLYYLGVMGMAGINFIRAYTRMLTSSGRRRMIYLMAGATAPALGSYPYLLFGSNLAARYPVVFWSSATLINFIVGALIVIMAYSVAFFGVSWPDRVVKSRLFKWIMRGPVTASLALAILTVVRRSGEYFGLTYNVFVPVSMVATVLIMEHLITLLAPFGERFLFMGNDRSELLLLQNLDEHFLTQGDLQQFLEAILAAVRDHMQSPSAFVAAVDHNGLTMLVNAGKPFLEKDPLAEALPKLTQNLREEILWRDSWILPLRAHRTTNMDVDNTPPLLGLLGFSRTHPQTGTFTPTGIDAEQRKALWLLADRASTALEDRLLQMRVFRSLEAIEPQVELIQRIRAQGRYDSSFILAEDLSPASDMAESVREALNHYWGGPKLTESPLMNLRVIQETARKEFDGNMANALRAILKKAVDQIKPEGERRFTSEWVLYNILDLKFMEGRKVREVANRLAMSEADLYRKQRVAVEAVAKAILEMESNFNTQ